jgi:hypothetical protein
MCDVVQRYSRWNKREVLWRVISRLLAGHLRAQEPTLCLAPAAAAAGEDAAILSYLFQGDAQFESGL